MSGSRFWGSSASRAFAQWAALLTGGVLLIPALGLPAGAGSALMAATVAVVITLTAVLADRRQQSDCAAIGMTLACGWAALAGADAFRSGAAAAFPAVDVDPMTVLVATGSALLLAGCAATSYPAALVHSIALLVLGLACLGLIGAAAAGVPVDDAGCGVALVAALLLGGLPRAALASGGLTGSGPGRESADVDDRITRADRVLSGGLVGISLVAAGGVIPAALAGDSGSRVLALGIGLLLLLRSRAYSQTRHVVAQRISGLVVVGAVWLGCYRSMTSSQSVLIVGAAVAAAALVVVIDLLERSPSPVGRARRGRILDCVEQFLVVELVVLTAWVVGLGEWVGSVIG